MTRPNIRWPCNWVVAIPPSWPADCAKLAEDWGYDEGNLNIGCPSDLSSVGAIWACVMTDPDPVAECVAAMLAAPDLPVTVKTRIGVDDQDSYEDIVRFVDVGSRRRGLPIFTVHARKAWLSGLSPKENLNLPRR